MQCKRLAKNYAYFQDNYADLLRTYGIKDCLTKPFDTVELVSRIEASLTKLPNAAP